MKIEVMSDEVSGDPSGTYVSKALSSSTLSFKYLTHIITYIQYRGRFKFYYGGCPRGMSG